MIFDIEFTDKAKDDLIKLKRSEPTSYKKANKLLLELIEHPETGTGKPEQLKGNLSGKWSRRITDKHRLIYEIFETEVKVSVVSTYGHYSDR